MLHCLESKKGPGKGASLFAAAVKAGFRGCVAEALSARMAACAQRVEEGRLRHRRWAHSLLVAFSSCNVAEASGAVQCGIARAPARAPAAHTRTRRAITPMLWLEDVGVSRSENWDHCAVALSLPFQGKKVDTLYRIHNWTVSSLWSVSVKTNLYLKVVNNSVFWWLNTTKIHQVNTLYLYFIILYLHSFYKWDFIEIFIFEHISWSSFGEHRKKFYFSFKKLWN